MFDIPKKSLRRIPRVNPGGAMIGVQNHRHAILLCYCAHVIGTTDSTSNGSMEIRVVQTFPWQNIEENGGYTWDIDFSTMQIMRSNLPYINWCTIFL